MTVYYIKRSNELRFDEVDEFVFKNRQHAKDDKGQPRYENDLFAVVDGQSVSINGIISKKTVGILTRIIGIDQPAGSVAGGYCEQPQLIPLVKGRSRFLYDPSNGKKYKECN